VETAEITSFGAHTCDLAVWCKSLRDTGLTGSVIARRLGKSEGYVNNLVRVVERASPAIMARWRAECAADPPKPRVCATDWLVQVCLLPHERQDEELARRIATW